MIRIALLAGICMIIQDSLAVIKYQAAARNRGSIVACADVIIWVFSITCTTIATFALHGHSMPAKIAVVVCVSIANVIGNLLGTYLGKRFVADVDNDVQDVRLSSLENRVAALETLTKNKG